MILKGFMIDVDRIMGYVLPEWVALPVGVVMAAIVALAFLLGWCL